MPLPSARRPPRSRRRSAPGVRPGLAGLLAFLVLAPAALGLALDARGAGASSISPFAPSWCTSVGASFEGWAGTSPEIPICGPGPYYGGPDSWVAVPGPYGADDAFFNATDGFQCVELAERFLAVVAGLAPVHANGSTVAMNYHAAYPGTRLVVNGTPGAVGHPPEPGDVVSFALGPSFAGSDGHVVVVVGSRVDRAGDGTVEIAQENVAPRQYLRTLDLVSWRLVDPEFPGNAEYQFPYAEWLAVSSSRSALALDPAAAAAAPALTRVAEANDAAVGLLEPEVRAVRDARALRRPRRAAR